MEQYIPPVPSLTQQIKDMKPETTLVVPFAPSSVKPIVSRVKGGKRFRTAKHKVGTQIWRDK